MNVVLTSFRDARSWKGDALSIARYQPKWSSMPDFPVDIRPIYNGKTIGEWMDKNVFKSCYEKIIKSKENDLISFFNRLPIDVQLVLCCWCNLDSDRQKKFKGKLFCHRILVGWWIEENFPYTKVIYADGSDKTVWTR